jgi:hypothetical protein
MSWKTLDFGKYAGRTLPEIIVSDADWFFWARKKDVFKGRLANEAEELGGCGCLNRISASISGGSAGVRPPRGKAAS